MERFNNQERQQASQPPAGLQEVAQRVISIEMTQGSMIPWSARSYEYPPCRYFNNEFVYFYLVSVC